MKPLILCFTTAGLLLNLPVFAATFKCVVDGKTSYQETPCSDEVKTRGAQSVITSPSKRADFSSGEITSGAENKRRDGLVKSDLEPRAREAFGALKGGKAMAYRDMLCLRARQALSRPVMANALKDAASDYTKRNIEITTVKSASSGAVSFNLETAVDHLNCSEKPEFTAVSGIQYRHQFSESATDVIARICGSLAALLLLAG